MIQLFCLISFCFTTFTKNFHRGCWQGSRLVCLTLDNYSKVELPLQGFLKYFDSKIVWEYGEIWSTDTKPIRFHRTLWDFCMDVRRRSRCFRSISIIFSIRRRKRKSSVNNYSITSLLHPVRLLHQTFCYC